MSNKKYTLGMIGLGTMGCNLLLNMADHGFDVAGYDKDARKVALLDEEGKSKHVKGFSAINDFVQSLKTPRTIMMLVPAGKIVDDVIDELLPILDKGDILIDGGNSHYTDTERRDVELEKKGFHFFGMGISGGEEGARKGPSMMPGGDKEAYQHVRPIFEAIAACVNNEPCVAYIGPGASGHFVKMVHNGIEYALMQLIAETYHLMNTGLQMDNASIQKAFKQWNDGRLQSFLMEVTSDIFAFKNPGDDHLLLDDIKDEAKSKGTGKWTSQIAMDIQLPIPVIDMAVAVRDLSRYKTLRVQISALYDDFLPKVSFTGDVNYHLKQLEDAFYFCMVTTYAQGMHMLYKASETFKYSLQPDEIAKIWRGGCIIRSAFLDDIFNAYQNNKGLEHLLTDEIIQSEIKKSIPAIRETVATAAINGIAIPAYTASLSYFDALKTARMPSNLIQAQRDYFGAHTYELTGKEGVFHTDWTNSNKIINTKN